MQSRFRADHVGPLLRPRALLDARTTPGRDQATLARLEDAAILSALARQQAVGLESLPTASSGARAS